MNKDDTIYVTLLLISIPLGLLFKNSKSPKFKTIWSTVIGFTIALIVCYLDIFHSLFIVAVNTLLIQFMHPKYLPLFSFVITFGYLLFFRTTEFFGLPKPAPYANAVQLILTLKIVGLAFEVSDTYKRKIKLKNIDVATAKHEEVESLKLQIEYSLLKSKPTWYDVFTYSYCYVGILTGPYFKYRTYKDWIEMKHGNKVDTFRSIISRGRALPFIIIGFLVLSKFVSFKDATQDSFYESTFSYRLTYMVLIFYLFRFRFYIAWIFAEISCMTAAFGAYPESTNPKPGAGATNLMECKEFDSSKPVKYSFLAIHNIDEYQCEMAPTVKQVLHHWNMTVQWWMANNVYRRVPLRSIGQPITMGVSAFWHGIHPGYYLSMLTTTPCILAENLMEKGLKSRLHPRYHRYYDACTWLFRTREFDYMSLGFILLRFDYTIRFWKSVYFIGHLTSLFFIIVGYILVKTKKPKHHHHHHHNQNQHATTVNPETNTKTHSE